MNNTQSVRSQVVTRRTYNRPLDDKGNFETWEQTVDRVIGHQQWLWERAANNDLTPKQKTELSQLRDIMLKRQAAVSGRTLWLGGTDVAKTREASQFNCSFGEIETVYDVVDGFWLLLQGCGVGFTAKPGVLNGFARPAEIEIIRSTKAVGDPKGKERNLAFIQEVNNERVYRLRVGDSAEAWAKSIGKLLALKTRVDRIIIDFTEIRAGGIRLKGYGWISSGDETISKAFVKICEILNKRAGKLLDAMDILDLMNHLGTTLSSRRSAQIALMDKNHALIDDFITAKKDFWLHGNEHRQQSNNSVVFNERPSKWDLRYIFDRMVQSGGSEPGFINGQAARKRAPYFRGVNPCAEILLGNKSFCNLVEPDWGKFLGDLDGLRTVIYYVARANYRQTCVDLRDGILQDSWHELNDFLRLCGVGATGIVKMLDHLKHEEGYTDEEIKAELQSFRAAAQDGANSMADELGMPRPQLVTTVKPSGTLSKVMDTTEGVHRPLGRYIFNNVTFSKHDEIIPTLRNAGYKVIEKPFESDSVLVTLPVAYKDVMFDKVDGKHVNMESAVHQLERYKLLMDNYVDHNCSITVSYEPEEVDGIIDWILTNWDSYVGVSFLFRNDATKTAADLGYVYLPQEVVTKKEYEAYVSQLSPVDLTNLQSTDDLSDEACAGGACPIR